MALKKVRMERERDGKVPTLVLMQLCCQEMPSSLRALRIREG